MGWKNISHYFIFREIKIYFLKMADVEVSELAKKLDEDLDKHFAETLEKNKDFKYKDGFTENIVEEAELIPAFMTGTPTQEQIDASPELQAMQALKYEQDDPHEAALAHKDDGNYHFQKKLYKSAILAYTEALKCQHDDATLKAVLYTNRAASNYYLGNKRSALNDAVWALKMKPDHMKAILRGAGPKPAFPAQLHLGRKTKRLKSQEM